MPTPVEIYVNADRSLSAEWSPPQSPLPLFGGRAVPSVLAALGTDLGVIKTLIWLRHKQSRLSIRGLKPALCSRFFFFFLSIFASPVLGFGSRTLSLAAFTSGAFLWGRSGAATPRGHGAVL